MQSELATESENDLIQAFSPLLEDMFKNKYRAGIVYLLAKTKQTNHAMTPSKLAYKLGTYHRNIIFHLEQLNKIALVCVKGAETKAYGIEKREFRFIWGLNTRLPGWIRYCVKFILSKWSQQQLEQIVSKNKVLRNLSHYYPRKVYN